MIRVRDDDHIAFDPRTGCIVELNQVGYALLKGLAEELPSECVVAALAKKFEVSEVLMAAEAEEFYAELKEHGFIAKEPK